MGTDDVDGPLFNMKSSSGWEFPQESFYVSNTSVEVSESEWPGRASVLCEQRDAGEMEILNIRL